MASVAAVVDGEAAVFNEAEEWHYEDIYPEGMVVELWDEDGYIDVDIPFHSLNQIMKVSDEEGEMLEDELGF